MLEVIDFVMDIFILKFKRKFPDYRIKEEIYADGKSKFVVEISEATLRWRNKSTEDSVESAQKRILENIKKDRRNIMVKSKIHKFNEVWARLRNE